MTRLWFKLLRQISALTLILVLAVPLISASLGLIATAEAVVSTRCATGLGANWGTPTYTTSDTIDISWSSLHCTTGTGTYNMQYVFIFVSNTSSNFNDGTHQSTYWYIGQLDASGNLPNSSFAAKVGQGFNMSYGGGWSGNGNHTVYVGITACDGNSNTNSYANFWPSAFTKLPGPHCYPAPPSGTLKNVFEDGVAPTAGGHLNATCFTVGSGVQVIDGGSSDPSPSSGWNTNNGMWDYTNNTGGDSGWTNTNNWTFTAPWSGGNYQAYERIRDNAGNVSAAYTMGYSIDGSAPTGGWVSASAYNTNSPTVNLSFAANAGGCYGMNNVAISNDNSSWVYLGYLTVDYNP